MNIKGIDASLPVGYFRHRIDIELILNKFKSYKLPVLLYVHDKTVERNLQKNREKSTEAAGPWHSDV